MDFILRPWKVSDAKALARHLNNKKIWDNCRDGLPFPYTETDADAFIKYKGLATAALERAIEHYFQHTDVIRLYATVYEHNAASMRVLEKAGFQKAGIHRKACFKNGQFIDAHYYELLKNKS